MSDPNSLATPIAMPSSFVPAFSDPNRKPVIVWVFATRPKLDSFSNMIGWLCAVLRS